MSRPFLAWPGWPFLRYAWLLSALHALWFLLVYGGCDWITAHRTYRVRLDLPGETALPFLPSMAVAYMSIYALFLAGPFILRRRREIAGLVGALAFCTLAGGIGFLLFPSVPSYPPAGDLGVWAALFHVADDLNLTYNMAPSLHVALSVCCVAAFVRRAGPPGRALLWAWAIAIALSTLFTHQHHLVDVVSGWALGWGAERFIMRRGLE